MHVVELTNDQESAWKHYVEAPRRAPLLTSSNGAMS